MIMLFIQINRKYLKKVVKKPEICGNSQIFRLFQRIFEFFTTLLDILKAIWMTALQYDGAAARRCWQGYSVMTPAIPRLSSG